MEWCPQHAMNAYLKTLHLRKIYGNEAHANSTLASSRLDEPKVMEFLSAMAAGNGAKLIVHVTTQGGVVSPITLALAVAARQTEGRFVCVVPDDHEEEDTKRSGYIHDHELIKDVAQFVVAGNPNEIVKQYKAIDFLVVDSKYRDHMNVVKTADLNPKGSVVVITNQLNGTKKDSMGEIGKAQYGVQYESVALLVGEGIELTKFTPCRKFDGRKYTRFHVTYEY